MLIIYKMMSIISPIYPKPKAFKMPVVTRSRSQCNSINNAANKQIKVEKTDPIQSQVSSKIYWFISICNKYLHESAAFKKEKDNNRLLGNASAAATNHFDNIRNVTELFYIINQNFPDIYAEDTSRFNLFGQSIYRKIPELYSDIANTVIKPKTREEFSSNKSLIEELQETEKMLMQYVPIQRPIRGAYVNYTGMDCIEDEDNSNIANIWIDLSIASDPDYDPENIEDQQQILEDEQDDENFDKYVVYDEEDEQDEEEQDTDEDEDLDEDDEEEDDEEDEEEEEGDEEDESEGDEEDESEEDESDEDDGIIEIMDAPKRNTHIRFIYDDDDEE